MSWFFFAIASHIVNATTFLADRFVLKRTVFNPLVSVFTISLFSAGTLFFLFLPIGFPRLPFGEILLSLASGAAVLIALIFFYRAIFLSEASRIAPLTGSLVPIFTILIAYGLGEEELTIKELAAFLFLVIGGLVIALEFGTVRRVTKGFPSAAAGAAFFALAFVLAHIVYALEPTRLGDVESFIWARGAGFFVLPFFLFSQGLRASLHGARLNLGMRDTLLFSFNRFLGMLAFVLLNIAFNSGSVSLVNALQGVQYVFLFIFAFFAVMFIPNFPKEELRGTVLFQKIVAIILIGIGIYLIV